MNWRIVCLTLLLAGTCAAKDKPVNCISGRIQNMRGGSLTLIWEEDINRKKRITVAEIAVDKTGRFSLKKKLQPAIYTLVINDGKSLMLAVDAGQNIFIQTDDTDTGKCTVSGSWDTKMLMAYETYRKESLDRLVNSVRRNITAMKQRGIADDAPELLQLNSLEVDNYDKYKNELIRFIEKNMSTSLAVYATSIRWSGDTNLLFLQQMATRFEAAHPNTIIAAKLREKVSVLAANATGSKSAEIDLPDQTGKQRALFSLKAKYILIDFWASWCAPCRRESVELTELYSDFNHRGFEIYAVSLDTKKETWLKAIAADNRRWINVSDFKGYESAACFDYAITALPGNVLIDSNGKIIGRNLHGEELKKILYSLF